MRTIHKFPVSKHLEFTEIEIPEGAQIMGVGLQDDENVVMWAIVDTEKPVRKRKFKAFLTGGEVPHFLSMEAYIGTFQIPHVFGNKPFVGHVFEV